MIKRDTVTRHILHAMFILSAASALLQSYAIAGESNPTLPIHGRAPGQPTTVTISLTNNKFQADASGYSDPDGDVFSQWQYLWSPDKARIISTERSIPATQKDIGNDVMATHYYVKVRAMAKSGYPASTRGGEWSDWVKTTQKSMEIVGSVTDCNDFTYETSMTMITGAVVDKVTIGSTVVGGSGGKKTTKIDFSRPLRKIKIARQYLQPAQLYAIDDQTYTFWDNTTQGVTTDTPSIATDTPTTERIFAAPAYPNGANVVAIAVCATSDSKYINAIKFLIVPA